MKKSQKGVTLVEVIVAIAVFSIISLALFSSVISMKTVVARQEEYVRIEMVCYDISAYHLKAQNEGKEWYQLYFGEEAERDALYLESNFEPTTDYSKAAYKIIYKDSNTISIHSADGSTVFVENVKFP